MRNSISRFLSTFPTLTDPAFFNLLSCSKPSFATLGCKRLYTAVTDQDDEARQFIKNFTIDTIPREACKLSYSRSSGPGGQNVNKLNTKACLRLESRDMSWLPNSIIEHLRSHASQYLTKDGDIVIQSQRNRTQELNKEDCFRKLADIIVDTANVSIPGETSPETQKNLRGMLKRGNERRIKTKKLHSSKKSARRGSSSD